MHSLKPEKQFLHVSSEHICATRGTTLWVVMERMVDLPNKQTATVIHRSRRSRYTRTYICRCYIIGNEGQTDREPEPLPTSGIAHVV